MKRLEIAICLSLLLCSCGREETVDSGIGHLKQGTEMYWTDHGRPPHSLRILWDDMGIPSYAGPYVKGGTNALVDRWGTPVTYSVRCVFTSAGPDREFGTSDDIEETVEAPNQPPQDTRGP